MESKRPLFAGAIFVWYDVGMIIGHERQQKLLHTHIERGALSHAYLFSGTAHIGKAVVAQAFMQSIACVRRPSGVLASCGSCPSCVSFVSGAGADIFAVLSQETKDVSSTSSKKERESIGIEEIRALKERVSQTSFAGGYKYFFIDDAAYMTREAANSILKILEEPLGNTIFVLVTRDASRVLPTIRSRVWEVKFWPVSPSLVASGLEVRGVSARKALSISNISQGLPGRAIAYTEMSEADIAHIQKAREDLEALFTPDHLQERLLAVAACEERDAYTRLLASMLDVLGHDFGVRLWEASGPAVDKQLMADARRYADMVKNLLALETELPRLYANMRLAFESAMISMR